MWIVTKQTIFMHAEPFNGKHHSKDKPKNYDCNPFCGQGKKRYILCNGNFEMEKWKVTSTMCINMNWTSVFERWKSALACVLEYRCTFNGHTMILVTQSKHHDIDVFVSSSFDCIRRPFRLSIWRALSIYTPHMG